MNKKTQAKQTVKRLKATNRLLVQELNQLRTVFNNQPAWVNICDQQGVIQTVNPAGVSIMEATSEKELLGKTLLDFITPSYKNEIHACRKKLAMGKITKHEIAVKTLKNNICWLEMSIVKLPDNSKNDIQIMSILCDKTQFKHKQQALLKRHSELAQTMRFNTIGAMASSLAHELNQPLAAINNYISGCQHRINNNNYKKEDLLNILHLTSIQVKRTSKIINHVKHFIQQDNLETEIMDVNKALKNAISLIRNTHQLNHTNIILKLEPNLPPIMANLTQIEQVAINLIINSIEAMEEINLTAPILEIHSQIKNKTHIEVAIKDRGKSMTSEEKKAIFKPFHTTKIKGMGMGLCISRTIIELHAGQLSVKDRPNGGSIFSFILPIYKEYK